MNGPFIIIGLIIFAGIITGCAIVGKGIGSIIIGTGIGILCVVGILFYGAIKTPWFH